MGHGRGAAVLADHLVLELRADHLEPDYPQRSLVGAVPVHRLGAIREARLALPLRQW